MDSTNQHMEPAATCMELQSGYESQLSLGAGKKQSINYKSKKKNRRGWGKKLQRKKFKNRENQTIFSIFGSNSNGIKGKLESLSNNVQFFKPSCINLQETKLRFPGTVKIDGYEVFENVRTGLGGGLLTAVDINANPVLISTGSEYCEAIIVQVKVGSKNIRIFNCYGPQEPGQAQRPIDEQKILINMFWQELEKEIINAYDDKCMILIEMDANAKVGWNHIKDDPNDTSSNGHKLLDLVDRQHLKILNCSQQCEGTITRKRVTVERTEQSVIDYVIACEELASYLQKMLVDEKRNHVLTKFTKQKSRAYKIESDHNSIFASFNLNYFMKKQEIRKEIFNKIKLL